MEAEEDNRILGFTYLSSSSSSLLSLSPPSLSSPQPLLFSEYFFEEYVSHLPPVDPVYRTTHFSAGLSGLTLSIASLIGLDELGSLFNAKRTGIKIALRGYEKMVKHSIVRGLTRKPRWRQSNTCNLPPIAPLRARP